ncbi:MAG TPA: putative Se/S carrier-like protein [Coriobacteriia bacterium]|nr:putative Se/S carrier-like protein [Coriobacteriia bacterium]
MTPERLRTYTVLGFATTHDALDAEQLLTDLGVPVVPVPAPAGLGHGLCGIMLRVAPDDAGRALTLLGHAGRDPVTVGETQDL